MTIDVNIFGKYKMAYGTEVEVSYTCPHCGESVSETICFSKDINAYNETLEIIDKM